MQSLFERKKNQKMKAIICFIFLCLAIINFGAAFFGVLFFGKLAIICQLILILGTVCSIIYREKKTLLNMQLAKTVSQ
jgi:hypothetical protein